ncbi:hypothetical protein BZG36_00547 [Bifiguratus adelaidae]|uniref:2-dehydropantoate 2-reductase n=1 Tax=Bifiguratus adelaidae TaxID=1938954 RepID=A0A261Y7S4_9FUNG|nr:hypothetical protein BZG36_00547 [Bifiguratus adelaidae]
MAFVILGAGSIGCHIGGALAHHPDYAAETWLVGRPRLRDAIAISGLTLTHFRQEPYTIPAAELHYEVDLAHVKQVAGHCAYLIITLKGPQMEEALVDLDKSGLVDRDTVLVSFQNGARNPALLRAVFPDNVVLGGMVPYNIASVPGEGVHFRQGNPGRMMIEKHAQSGPLVKAMQNSGLSIEEADDIEGVMYGKLSSNLNNAINALSNLPLLQEFSTYGYRSLWARCIQESLDVYANHSPPITIVSAPALPFPHWLFCKILGMPDMLARYFFGKIGGIHEGASSSMRDDLQRSQKTEIDDLNGWIVKLAVGGDVMVDAEDVDRSKQGFEPRCKYVHGIYHLVKEVERRQALRGEWAGWMPSLSSEAIVEYVEKGDVEAYPF